MSLLPMLAILPINPLKPLDPSKISSVSDIVMILIQGLLILGGAVALIYIIWSGIQYVTSAGDPAKAEKAKNGLVYAIIGIVVMSLALVIVNMVKNFVISGTSSDKTQSEQNQGSTSGGSNSNKNTSGGSGGSSLLPGGGSSGGSSSDSTNRFPDTADDCVLNPNLVGCNDSPGPKPQ